MNESYDFTRGRINKRSILTQRKFRFLDTGFKSFAVEIGGDIQAAVDAAHFGGGGSVRLAAGTYSLTSHLVLYDNIRLQGAGSGGTIIDFGGGAFSIRVVGVHNVSTVDSVFLEGFTVQNSTADLVLVQYATNFNTDDLTCSTGLIGLHIDNCSTANIYRSLQDACGTGLKCTNSELITVFSTNTTNCTTGGGQVFDTVSNSAFIGSSVDGCVGGGYSIKNSSNIGVENFAITNITGIGIEFISGNTGGINVSVGFIDSCSSDGIKLTASTDLMQFIGNIMSNNGGYGMNIAASSCDKNLVSSNTFNSNTTANMTNSGTGTLIRSNIGVADN